MKLHEWIKINKNNITQELVDISTELKYNSMKQKVQWRCQKGHIYKAEPRRILVMGRGCPFCSGKQVSDEYNSLYKTHPKLAEEWDYSVNDSLGINPHTVTAGSNKIVGWKCKNGHTWKAMIANRGIRNSGCPHCNSGSQTSFMEQLVYTLILNNYQDALNRAILNGFEFDIWIPSINVAIEYNGRLYHSDLSNKTNIRHKLKEDHAAGSGIQLININEMYDNIGVNIDGLNINIGANNSSANRDKLISIIATALQEVFETKLNIAFSNISTSTICEDTNKRIEEVEISGSLGSLYPDISKEWDEDTNGNITPFMVRPSSNKKYTWKCNVCQYKWVTSPAHRVNDGTGCPACAARRSGGGSHLLLVGENDLMSLRPDIYKQIDFEKCSEDGINPSELRIKSNKRIWWKCVTCGNSWQAPVSRRTTYNSGCPYCTHRKV